MSVHVFVDESMRAGYLLVATVLPPSDLHVTRKLLRSLLLRGERRVHFKAERDPRRRFIVARLCEARPLVHVYRTRSTGEIARALLLKRLVCDAIDSRASRLVIESRTEVANGRDRAVIAATLANEPTDLVYEHMPASTEPALWISDCVAWCYGAGGDWRRRIDPVIGAVFDCDAP